MAAAGAYGRAAPAHGCAARAAGAVGALLEVLGSRTVHLLLYVWLMVMLQLLGAVLRRPEEYEFGKAVADRLIRARFDAAGTTFLAIRSIPDIYEWGNYALIPGLFHNQVPCSPAVGKLSGEGDSNTWADGTANSATPLGISEHVKLMDMLDWTAGIYLRQGRAKAQSCSTKQLGECYPELRRGEGSTAEFGYNWTNSSHRLENPYIYFTRDQLGANPSVLSPSAFASTKSYDSDGFVALAIPFFSSVLLPSQEGSFDQVTDYRLYAVTPGNDRQAQYFCVRVSSNGLHVKQLCERGFNGLGGEPAGAVRSAIEEWWNDLRRGHFLDAQSRVLTITLQLRANNVGIAYRISLMFEMTASGALLPSFDVMTRLLDSSHVNSLQIFGGITLGVMIALAIQHLITAWRQGLLHYVANPWNIIDSASYILYFVLYGKILYLVGPAANDQDCSSYICSKMGFFDDYNLMESYRGAKLLLSVCVCLQLLNIIRLFAILIPRMGFSVKVFRKCAVDMIFFGAVFVCLTFAFSNLFYFQLGHIMEAHRDQATSFFSLFRALIGNFDFGELATSSRESLSMVLFLGYLFLALFIALSIFVAFLLEALFDARREERTSSSPAVGIAHEYGVFGVLIEKALHHLKRPLKLRVHQQAQLQPNTTPSSHVQADGSAVADYLAHLQLTMQVLYDHKLGVHHIGTLGRLYGGMPSECDDECDDMALQQSLVQAQDLKDKLRVEYAAWQKMGQSPQTPSNIELMTSPTKPLQCSSSETRGLHSREVQNSPTPSSAARSKNTYSM